MTIRICRMTHREGGVYDLSPDMAPDLLDGDVEQPIGDVGDWLRAQDYVKVAADSQGGCGDAVTDRFVGWGDVWEHSETGGLLSVTEEDG